MADFLASETIGRTLDEPFQYLLQASSQVLYRMSPDWTEMRQLGGGGFLSDTQAANWNWLQDYIPPEEHSLVREAVAQAIEGRTIFQLEHRVKRIDGSVGWASSRAVPLVGEDGELIEWFGAASDITARKEAEEALRSALKEREALLKEIHHRVKNNLQVIASLLEMQGRQLSDRKAKGVLAEARNRVASIAAIHDYLHRSQSSSEVDVVVYARDLVRHLLWFTQAEGRIETSVAGEGIVLDLERSMPFGLLLNELLSNACKHAFPDDMAGRISISFRNDDQTLCVQVSDTGIGLPSNFETRTASSLGVSMVHTLAEQLKGTVTFHTDRGTHVHVRIPRS